MLFGVALDLQDDSAVLASLKDLLSIAMLGMKVTRQRNHVDLFSDMPRAANDPLLPCAKSRANVAPIADFICEIPATVDGGDRRARSLLVLEAKVAKNPRYERDFAAFLVAVRG